jgi:hypothetical protein
LSYSPRIAIPELAQECAEPATSLRAGGARCAQPANEWERDPGEPGKSKSGRVAAQLSGEGGTMDTQCRGLLCDRRPLAQEPFDPLVLL